MFIAFSLFLQRSAKDNGSRVFYFKTKNKNKCCYKFEYKQAASDICLVSF